jgi:adenylate cyclase
MSSETVQRRLAAIFAADIVGFSRLMGTEEEATLARLKALRAEVINPAIASHHGRIFKTTGDGLLAEFASVVAAVQCAAKIQIEMASRGAADLPERRIVLRIGINLGDIIIEGDEIYGDGVNIAARLEGICAPGGVAMAASAHEQVRDKIAYRCVDRGEHSMKNIARPVHMYALDLSGPGIAEATLALPDKPSLAVLPFTNMSGDPEQEYFTDGVTEDIITDLSRFHSLFVIARNSSFSYKGKSPDVRQVGKELGVRYVLEGSIRRAGNRIRVTAQLIDALTGNHVWAERYDRVLEDIFAVQEEVTRSIVAAIAPQVEDAEIAASRRVRPGNLSAYEIAVRAYANAAEAYRIANLALRDQAIREAKEALAKDSGSLLALNALAFSQQQHVLFRTTADVETAWQEGMAAAIRAISLDRSDHRAYVWKGLFLLYATGEVRWDEALANLRRANELNPNDAIALFCLGLGETFSGNPHQGIEYLTRWLRLSPHDPLTYNVHLHIGIACFLARNYEETLQWASLANREAPDHPIPYLFFALAYVGLAEIDKAKAALDRVRRIAPEFVQARLEGFAPYRKAEDRERYSVFLRIAAGLEDPSAADALR